ncbi:late embryogenesis abundant protein ECP63-like [Miscanthus floridulus]|uniref:late embryogenesis abundant protein ECP63-like n=1 Tax=Miscanthus floridulus TaxID=154761 RepID=UPI0034585273
MASMQKSREERALSAAQKAADELAASRRDQQVHEATTPVSPRGGGGGGILSSVQESARTVMGAAKKYAVDKGAWLALAGDAVARKGETDESAWQQGQDVRRRAAEEARRVHEPSEEEKGRAATENIYGMAKGAMAGTYAEKMVMPTDVVERKRAEAAGGGDRKAAVASPATGIGDDDNREPNEEEDVMLRVKAAADQMTGQAFNDVGKMGEEGSTGMPRRR